MKEWLSDTGRQAVRDDDHWEGKKWFSRYQEGRAGNA